MTKGVKIFIGIAVIVIIGIIVFIVIKKKKANSPAAKEEAAQAQAQAAFGQRLDSTGKVQLVVQESKSADEIKVIKDELQKATERENLVRNQLSSELATVSRMSSIMKPAATKMITDKYTPLIAKAVSDRELWQNKLAAAFKG